MKTQLREAWQLSSPRDLQASASVGIRHSFERRKRPQAQDSLLKGENTLKLRTPCSDVLRWYQSTLSQRFQERLDSLEILLFFEVGKISLFAGTLINRRRPLRNKRPARQLLCLRYRSAAYLKVQQNHLVPQGTAPLLKVRCASVLLRYEGTKESRWRSSNKTASVNPSPPPPKRTRHPAHPAHPARCRRARRGDNNNAIH